MTPHHFVKGHCAGSTALVLIDRDGSQPVTEAQTRMLCDTRYGAGADLLVRVLPVTAHPAIPHLRALAPDAEWYADIFSADGAPSNRVASALRIAATALTRAGLATPERRDTLPFLGRTGVSDVLLGAASVTIDLGRWNLNGEHLVKTIDSAAARPALGITLNSGHAVVALPSLADLDAVALTEAVRLAPATASPEPSRGTASAVDAACEHVVFLAPGDPVMRDGVGRIHTRVFDVHTGETAPDGEAAAAAALAFRHWGGPGLPHHWRVETPWGSHAVRMFPTEAGEHVSVATKTTLIADGTLLGIAG